MGESSNNPVKNNWIIDIRSELLKTSPTSSSWSICKVPVKLRSVNEDAYTPHIISIGPIHHQDEKLLHMEDHKRWYLVQLFNRAEKTKEEIIGKFYDKFALKDLKLRLYYAEPIVYDEQELAKILLHDAGFILELFYRYYESENEPKNQRENEPENSEKREDPIFTTSWMLTALQRDLALLENQIPFFVLEILFDLIHAADIPIKDLAFKFFKRMLNMNEEVFQEKRRQNKEFFECRHLLHFLYNSYVPSKPRASTEAWEFISSATSLSQAGVVFEKIETNNLFDLQFDNGTFKIPSRTVDSSTDSLIRNLVAFEQCQQDSKYYITSYIVLMDRLIDTTNDVNLLQRAGIIVNDLSTEDDVSDIFNNICKGTVLRPSKFYFPKLCHQVNRYAKARCHRYKAAARRDYFKSPWSITSFVAAIAIVLFTFLQTLYTLLAYYYKS